MFQISDLEISRAEARRPPRAGLLPEYGRCVCVPSGGKGLGQLVT
jgi:hypothetical protein